MVQNRLNGMVPIKVASMLLLISVMHNNVIKVCNNKLGYDWPKNLIISLMKVLGALV